MSTLSRLLRRLALPLVMFGAAVGAHAAVGISFLYNGHGTVSSVECGPACLTATIEGVANDWAGLASPVPDDWEVLVSETVDLGAGTFTGSFIYADTGPGANSFLGSLTGTFTAIDATRIKAEVMFVVEGGTGMFSGATGMGQSTVYADLAKGQYVEAGLFDVMVVPEPQTWALMLGGLLMLGMARSRRRSR